MTDLVKVGLGVLWVLVLLWVLTTPRLPWGHELDWEPPRKKPRKNPRLPHAVVYRE